MTSTAKIILAVVVVGAVGALGYVSAKKNSTKAADVRVEKVESRDLVETVTASGQIDAKTRVNVSADVSGKIIRLSVKEGDMVKKGQFLLQIDPEQVTASLQRAEAQLSSSQAQEAQAKANMIQAQRNYDRSLELKQQSALLGVTEEQLEQLKTQAEVNKQLAEAASFSVDQARATVRDARQALNKTTIIAPMSGRITRLVVQEGETAIQGNLNRDAATLLVISDMSVLETKVKVDETNVARVKIGDSSVVEIDAFPDTTFVGRVVEISHSSVARAAGGGGGDQAVDYEVKVQLLNPPEETRPDFSATARIVTATRKNTLAIPIIALTVRENEKLPNADSALPAGLAPPKQIGQRDVEGVFIVGADNKVTFRPVKVGIAGERHFEVLEGLKAGETIVSGTYQAIRELKDGALVKPQKPDEKTAPATGKKS